MENKLLVPDIGDFDQVEIIEILVKKGDKIKKNDSLVTLESDKSSVEVPSISEGEDNLLPALGKRKLDEPKSFSENDPNPSYQERVHEIIQRLRTKNTDQKT